MIGYKISSPTLLPPPPPPPQHFLSTLLVDDEHPLENTQAIFPMRAPRSSPLDLGFPPLFGCLSCFLRGVIPLLGAS